MEVVVPGAAGDEGLSAARDEGLRAARDEGLRAAGDEGLRAAGDDGSTAAGDAGSTAAGPASPGRWRLALLALLVAVLVAGAGAAVWAAGDGDVDPDRQQADREAVMEQARQFMLRVNTYGPDLLEDDGTMPEYRALVSEVITPKFRTDFEENVTVAEQTVAQAGLGRTAEVYGVGVSTLDEDSATALVAGAFTNSYPRTGKDGADAERVEDQPAPFRVEVQLVLTDGDWLVDDFSPVTGEEEQ